GLPVVLGRADTPARRAPDGWEAEWRRARHAFLHDAATALGARVVTAHTADDQVETVLMRVLRGSGARGLAGLEAASPIVRPFLRLRRSVVETFAVATGAEWVEDPSNGSAAHLRNRVRHDLLPALRLADAGIDDRLLDIGRRAARWRAEMERVADEAVRAEALPGGGLSVASEELYGYDRDSLAVLWGALAGRVGLALDRRGTHRLATFIMNRPVRGIIPLSGGWCLEARPAAYHLRRDARISAAPATLPERGTVEWGRFRFRPLHSGDARPPHDPWAASFAGAAALGVRGWTAGDRLAPAGGQPRRRVARYLSEAGVRGADRAGWPVVVRGEEVVWIPGVRRSDAATDRSGGPALAYVCERIAP
ncbi:MAG: tRNA(Ile)-lysidine synthase, partial [Gemmatimonadetes bacterium]|nr:tRNA(Ile)-lysidine synthase [Gemmatimonadota bacterium]